MKAKPRLPALPLPSLQWGQRWWVFAPPFLMMALAVGANVLIGVGLARLLEPTALGKYMVLIAASGTVSLFGSRGQPMLTKRLYALQAPGTYDWLRDLGNGLRYSAPVLAGVLAGAILLYRLPMNEALQLALLVPLSLVLLFVSQVLQAERHYALGNVLVRLPNAVLLGLLAPIFVGRHPLTLGGAVTLRILAALIACAIGTVWLFSKTTRGADIIERDQRSQGRDYLALSATSLMTNEGVIVLAGLVLPPVQMGAFAALMILTRPLHMLQLVVVQVLSVEIAQRKWTPNLWEYGGFVVAAVMGTAVGIVIFPAAIHWLYAGRYDDYGWLAVPLMLSATLTLLEAWPRAALNGRAVPALIRAYSSTQVVVALAGAAAILVGGRVHGIGAVAWALCLYALARYVVSAGATRLLLAGKYVLDARD